MRFLPIPLFSIALLALRTTVAFAGCSPEVGPLDHRSPGEIVAAIADAAECFAETRDRGHTECHNFSRHVFEKAKSVGSVVSFAKVVWIFPRSNGTLLDQNRKETYLSHHAVTVLRVAGDPSDFVVDLTAMSTVSRQSIDSWVKERFSNAGFYFVKDENVHWLNNKWWDPTEKGGAFR
jgi:hypothetical protein